jgi:DNA modification methylase
LGLENTPEEYVQKMVETFREVKRVLRPDGTFWLNLGDSYAGSWGDSGHRPERDGVEGTQREKNTKFYDRRGHPQMSNPPTISCLKEGNLKPKDLVGIPWRVAFALQNDGWWLRSDIIWNKPNPMPSSVTDRPTKSHEYIFLLTKSARYYYDAESIKEPQTKIKERPDWLRSRKVEHDNAKTEGMFGKGADLMRRWLEHPEKFGGGRNKRSVWTITTKPFAGSHFATFPSEIPELCIKAGTSQKGACPKCGAPWERIIENSNPSKEYMEVDERIASALPGSIMSRDCIKSLHRNDGGVYSSAKTIGWQPTCSCGITEVVPCIVLDPFLGSGTTIEVANNLGRTGLGFELNPEYENLIRSRVYGKIYADETFLPPTENIDDLWK